MDLQPEICFELLILIYSQLQGALDLPILFRLDYYDDYDLPIKIVLSFACLVVINFVFALFSSDWKKWSERNFRNVCLGFLCGTFGSGTLFLYVVTFAYATPKLAGIVATVVPDVFFWIDVCRGKEKLGVAKVIAISMTYPAAICLAIMNEGPLLVKDNQTPITTILVVVALFIGCIISSRYFNSWATDIIKEKMMNSNVCDTFTMATLINLSGLLVSLVIYPFFPHGRKPPGTGRAVFTCFIVLLSSIATTGVTWCIQRKRKPDYVAAFSNISLIIDTIEAPFVFDGKVQTGSWVCFGLLVIGLGTFHLVKIKEEYGASMARDAASIELKEVICSDRRPQEDTIDHVESAVQRQDESIISENQVELATKVDSVVLNVDQVTSDDQGTQQVDSVVLNVDQVITSDDQGTQQVDSVVLNVDQVITSDDQGTQQVDSVVLNVDQVITSDDQGNEQVDSVVLNVDQVTIDDQGNEDVEGNLEEKN